jgi:hypothetical protein
VRAASMSPSSTWISPRRLSAGSAPTESTSTAPRARWATGTAPSILPWRRSAVACSSRSAGLAGGETFLGGLGVVRFKGDLVSVLEFDFEDFVFAIVNVVVCCRRKRGGDCLGEKVLGV